MIEREEQIFELWNKHPFAERALQTACGQDLRILSPGILNRDSGPDFFGARIELEGQVWSGNIEIHVRASDWLRHGHTTDKAFSNVILHVVCVHDCSIYDDHGNVIPVLVLTNDLLCSSSLGSARDDSGVKIEEVQSVDRQSENIHFHSETESSLGSARDDSGVKIEEVQSVDRQSENIHFHSATESSLGSARDDSGVKIDEVRSVDRQSENIHFHSATESSLGSARDDSRQVVEPVNFSLSTLAGTDQVLEPESSRAEPRGGGPMINTVGAMQSLESLGVERLYRLGTEMETELENLKGDMEALFQRKLFRRFGMGTNSEPFQQLAHRLPGSIIRRQRNNVTDLEALLYGQSALLPEIPADGYSADLLYRYVNFRYKYNLEPMYVQAWKFMRMRPSNFPTIRISQLAMLLHKEEHIYTRCMDASTGEPQLREMLDVKASEYWDDHFRFGVYSGRHAKQIGEEAVDSILINAVATLRYFLGLQRDDENLKDSAVELLRELRPENNAAIRKSGRKPMNALQSQGLLEVLTRTRGSNDTNNIVSDCNFEYFSATVTKYERNQIHRSDCNMVREPGIRRLRLVG